MIDKNEKLYRTIKRSKPDALKNGRATSALFKDEVGVSVDRKGQRREEDVIEAAKKVFAKRYKGIVRFSAGICIKYGIKANPEPSVNNKFHTCLYDEKTNGMLTSLQCLVLADACETIDLDNSIEWTCTN